MSSLKELFESIFTISPSERSLALLTEVAESFSRIPYENLTKILQISDNPESPPRFRLPEQILKDYYLWGTGGTCFSLTNCLREVLKLYGYSSSFHIADLGSGKNNHCALVVTCDNRQFLIDPGYLITSPLPLPHSGSVIHATRLFPVRLEYDARAGKFHLSTLEPSGEKYRYALHANACSEIEFATLWAASFSWNMMRSLIVTRGMADGRLYLHDRYLRMITPEGKTGGKIKGTLDRQIAEKTGIHIRIVRQAIESVAVFKPKLLKR